MADSQRWSPEEYDRSMSFVSGFGKGLIDWLSPQEGELILDWGCGTGDLAYSISRSGAEVTGMDFSHDMVRAASVKYPELHFIQGNGEHYTSDISYDAIFSNAALHWMKDAKSAALSIHRCLKPGGRFIAEFGGQGNIEMILKAALDTLKTDYGIEAAGRNPWYFPTLGQYTLLLEEAGFRVTQALHYERPTPLPDGEKGVQHWLSHFGQMLFSGMNPQDKKDAYHKISERVKPALWNGEWYSADYTRLRIAAIKCN